MVTSLIPQWVQDVNTVLGIAGFFITLIVMFQVRSIRLTFRARARIPQVTKELQKAGFGLNSSLADWPARKNESHEHIKIASSLIENAIPFVPRAARRKMARINKKLSVAAGKFSETHYDRLDAVWDLYSDIQAVITTLTQVEKNLNWE